MSQRFIKFIPGEKADWLRKHHLYAFVLLSVIAQRARRTAGHIDGFELGWALVGDYEEYGLTRQNYRTALKLLESYKIIEILHFGKKDKKSTINLTIKKTINGTLVKLCDSSVWDINVEDYDNQNNHLSNHRVTIDQPSTNHEQERIKKEKKEEREDSGSLRSPSSLDKKKINKEKKASASQVALEIFEIFENSYRALLPTAKAANKKDAHLIDRLLTTYTAEQITSVISFAHGDKFWHTVITSVKQLEKKFESLFLAEKSNKKPIRIVDQTREYDGYF